MQFIYNFLIGIGVGLLFIGWTKINQFNKEQRLQKEQELKEQELEENK